MKLKALAVFILIAAVTLIAPVVSRAQSDETDFEALESRVKGTIRSLGSTQLAYQGVYGEMLYGSFEDLQEHQYISEGYTYDNMVDGYTFRVFLPEDRSGFTVMAIPLMEELSLYAITENQVIYTLTPIDMPEENLIAIQENALVRIDASPQLEEPEQIGQIAAIPDNPGLSSQVRILYDGVVWQCEAVL